jgi:DNA-binding NarL/FixJ family response regulator
MSEPIRVLIADDDAPFRRAIIAVLIDEIDIEVVAEASDGEEAITLVTEHAPHVVLMDVRMPGLGGVEAARILNEIHPSTKVAMLTVSDEDADLFGSIKAGASGYLLKDSALEDIADVIREVRTGNAMLSPSMASKLLAEFASMARPADGTPVRAQLSSDEFQILQHVTRGLTTKEVGAKLDIRDDVVKHHVSNVVEKFHVLARIEAARTDATVGD